MTAILAMPQEETLMLDIIRDQDGFYALEPFWDTLVDQMAIRSPFVRWDWMRLWWEECGAGAQLALAVLRDVEGIPQAIAPLMLARENDRARRHLVTLAFLGGFGPAHGERLDFIVPAGHEDELTPQLCRVFTLLRDECDLVRLSFLPQESPNTPHIFAALEGGVCPRRRFEPNRLPLHHPAVRVGGDRSASRRQLAQQSAPQMACVHHGA